MLKTSPVHLSNLSLYRPTRVAAASRPYLLDETVQFGYGGSERRLRVIMLAMIALLAVKTGHLVRAIKHRPAADMPIPVVQQGLPQQKQQSLEGVIVQADGAFGFLLTSPDKLQRIRLVLPTGELGEGLKPIWQQLKPGSKVTLQGRYINSSPNINYSTFEAETIKL